MMSLSLHICFPRIQKPQKCHRADAFERVEMTTTMPLTQAPSPASVRVASVMASSPLSLVSISNLVGRNDDDSDDECDSSLMSSPSLVSSNQQSDQPNGVVVRVTKMTSLIENLRCKLSQNRSSRDGRSDSLRSILSSSIGNCNVDESMIVARDKHYTNGHISSTIANTDDLEHEANSVGKIAPNEMEAPIDDECAKKYKVDLVPRIAKPKLDEVMKENININLLQNITHQEIFSTTKALSLHQVSSSTSMQKQQRALKCLQDALQIMQSKSSDSSSSTVSSLGNDHFVDRLNSKLLSKRHNSKAFSTNADSNRNNRRDDNNTRTWLDGSLDKEYAIAASSTFSISPMTNESKSISYVGSILLKSEGKQWHVRQTQSMETVSIIHTSSLHSLSDNSPKMEFSTHCLATDMIQLEQQRTEDATQPPIYKGSPNGIDNVESNVIKSTALSSRPPLSPKPPISRTKRPQRRSPIRSPSIFRGVYDKVQCHQNSSNSTNSSTSNIPPKSDCLDNALVATPHIENSSTKLVKLYSSTTKENDHRSISTKCSCLKHGYDSIGATSPAYEMTPAASFNPLAFEAELLMTPPNPGPLKKQRMFANHDTCVETKESPLQEVCSIASALDDTFVIVLNETPETQLSMLSERVKMVEKSQALNCSDANLKNNMNTRTSANQKNDVSALRDLVKTLEDKILLEKEEKLYIEEQRSSIERQLKEEIIRNACIKAELESEKQKVTTTIQEHSSIVQKLQSQISNHNVKVEYKAEMGITKALAQDVNQSIRTMQDETSELYNKKLLHKQKRLEYELQSCTTDNDTLRQCLLSHVSEVSAKEHTYAFALSQLNSLSNCHYELLQSLNYDKYERKEEVNSLQLRLDKMSRQMVQLNQQNHDLQSENDMLRNSRNKQCVEEQRSMFFRRGVRGAYDSRVVMTYPSQQNNVSHHQRATK